MIKYINKKKEKPIKKFSQLTKHARKHIIQKLTKKSTFMHCKRIIK